MEDATFRGFKGLITITIVKFRRNILGFSPHGYDCPDDSHLPIGYCTYMKNNTKLFTKLKVI